MHETTTGFEASISLPTTDDGFFGRCCPQCERRFTLESGRWNDDSSPPLTCCYCGFASNLDDFTTPEQEELIEAAIDAAVNAYIEQKVDEVFGGLRRHTSTNRFVRITIEPSRRLIPSLPEHVEAQARRVLVCGTCDSRYGVLGSAAFCPSCGPRHPAETLADAVLASRRALALEDALTDEGREQAQADGVLDDLAANAIKSVVSFFEAAIPRTSHVEYLGPTRSSPLNTEPSSNDSTMSLGSTATTSASTRQTRLARSSGSVSGKPSSNDMSSSTNMAMSTRSTSTASPTPAWSQANAS